jgi:hypothetical protein
MIFSKYIKIFTKLRYLIAMCLLVLGNTVLAQLALPLSISMQPFTAENTKTSGTSTTSSFLRDEQPVERITGQIDESSIREAEMRYLPMALRYQLEASGTFAAVRLLPLTDTGAEITLSGKILQSTPHELSLSIKAVDSRGFLLLDKIYSGTAQTVTSLESNALLDDDFAAIYRSITQDLQQSMKSLTITTRETIITQALMNYAIALVPQYFTQYLDTTLSPAVLVRLPAKNDPILSRIEAIREREYLFIDVVDEEHRRFFNELKPVYDLWREYRREQDSSVMAKVTQEQQQTSTFPRGSYYALQESYQNYRWSKLQDLYLDELREGFANETEPTTIELRDSLYRLNGTMAQQYREWRDILAEIYAEELGVEMLP